MRWLFRKEYPLIYAAESERKLGSLRNPVNYWGSANKPLCRPTEAEVPLPRDGAGLVRLRRTSETWTKKSKEMAPEILSG